ncbi:MAG: hypothetical protein ACI8QS_002595 [Planctomycetota bacterium]
MIGLELATAVIRRKVRIVRQGSQDRFRLTPKLFHPRSITLERCMATLQERDALLVTIDRILKTKPATLEFTHDAFETFQACIEGSCVVLFCFLGRDHSGSVTSTWGRGDRQPSKVGGLAPGWTAGIRPIRLLDQGYAQFDALKLPRNAPYGIPQG